MRLVLRALDGLHISGQGDLGGAHVVLRAGQCRVGSRLCCLQVGLRTIQRCLSGIDLRLRQHGLLRRRASRGLRVCRLVLGQRRLGLFERRLQVGGVEFGEHVARLDLLADGDIDLS
ncbi:MAG TPA: hypothetical protein VK898_15820 [Chloroflexota bacterium]|nr:hypothetical protein [Chloroflexota bacterium]